MQLLLNYISKTLSIITIVLTFGDIYLIDAGTKCSRKPEGHGATDTPADGRFHIRISESSEKYTPKETYTSN